MAVGDVLTVVKLQFFSFIAKQFKQFLTVQQIHIPMITYMFQDLKRLVLHLLVLITKLAVVDSSKDLSQFDFKEKENGLPLKVINM